MTLQQVLASPDDEWSVLQPKLDKVITLLTEVNAGSPNQLGGGGGGGRGGRGGGGGGGGGAAAATSAAAAALQEIYTILNNAGASDEQVKAKLEAYRQAKQNAEAQLKQAQNDLKSYVTLRQEAILISLGYLE